jgi:hypothetical protein
MSRLGNSAMSDVAYLREEVIGTALLYFRVAGVDQSGKAPINRGGA